MRLSRPRTGVAIAVGLSVFSGCGGADQPSPAAQAGQQVRLPPDRGKLLKRLSRELGPAWS